MTALGIPAALAIALRCAPAEDPGMLVGIARQESGLEPLTLRDNTSGQVLRGAGVIEAARRLIAAGHSVDLGPWQINSRNLSLLGLGVADAFEPCKSGGSPAARAVQPVQHRQSVARDRERLRRRGDDRDPRGQARQPGHASSHASNRSIANFGS